MSDSCVVYVNEVLYYYFSFIFHLFFTFFIIYLFYSFKVGTFDIASTQQISIQFERFIHIQWNHALRTPASYEQFRSSRQKAHIFSLKLGNLRTTTTAWSTTTGSELPCTAQARSVNFVVVVSSTTPNKVESRRPAIHKFRQGRIQDFFRRGCTRLLLYFNTNKPHSFFCRIPAVLENRRSSQGGGGGCAPPAPSP